MTSLAAVEKVSRPYLHVVPDGRTDVPTVDDEEVERFLGRLEGDGRLSRLLDGSEVDEPDRSARLYETAALLRDAGATPETSFAILARSPYNKFEGRDDEATRLWEAIERSRVSESGEVSRRRSLRQPVLARSIGTLLARDVKSTEWCIEGIWEDGGWGFVAGEPKTFKSTFTTDLAISMATGKPFLGHFDVCKPGPVLIVQEENAESIQHSRIRRILEHKECGGKIHSINDSILEFTPPEGDCPVYCIDRSRFSFGNTKKRRALEAEIAALQPKLVILDPLQRMMGDLSVRDEKDVTKALDWMDKVVNSYNTGMMVVHHYNKGREDGPKLGGQRMLGSQALHAWLSCGLYLSRVQEGERGGRIRVNREFRAFNAGSPFELEFDSHDDEDFYSVHVEFPYEEKKTRVTEKQVELLQILTDNPWKTATEYAAITGKGRRTVGEMLERMGAVKKRKKNTDGGRPQIVFGPPPKVD